jgi:hypothetical protein
LIEQALYRDKKIIESGPLLHVRGMDMADWSPDQVELLEGESSVVVKSSGSYGDITCGFDVSIFGDGTVITTCTVSDPPLPGNRNQQNTGAGFGEVGISYILSSDIDRLSWDRRALWSAYPENHIGRARGTAVRKRPAGREVYRQKPVWDWSFDMKNFFLNGRNHAGYGATNDFRALKENIWFASAILTKSKYRVRVESRANHAVRLEPLGFSTDSPVKLVIDCRWNYPDLRWGNYMKEPIWIVAGESFTVQMRLTDNDSYLEE